MDWQAWKLVFLGMGGYALLLAVAVFLVKKWVGVRIEESVKHEYAKKLEEHKADLQEQVSAALSGMEHAYQESVDQKATDKALFARLIETLPTNGSISFITHWDVGAMLFNPKKLRQLRVFYLEWNDPEHEFLDADLEAKRRHLHRSVDRYLGKTEECFFSQPGSDLVGIPPEWQISKPELFQSTMDELNRLADDVASAHKDLLVAAREKLKC